MKNRLLPLALFILIIGSAALFISASFIGPKKKAPPRNSFEYLEAIRCNQNTGLIAITDELRAREQIALNQNSSSNRNFDFNWKELGPNNAGGRTRALLFDNRDASGLTLYAGGVLGGMFKSTDGGNSWSKINAEKGNLRVTCLAQSSDGTIFAGTGEGFTVGDYTILGEWNYSNGFIGQGLFQSTDGETFDLIPSTEPDGENWVLINELAVSGSDHIFAATNTGLQFSNNKGSSWTTATTNGGEALSGSSMEVVAGPDGLIVTEVNNLCYISPDGNPGNFILRSTDSTYDLPNQGVGRLEFAIPVTDGNIIYAIVVTVGGALEGVYRSDNKGETWYVVGPGGSKNFNVFNTGSNVNDGQGVYTCEIAVFPDNPDKILIGGIDMWLGLKVLDEELFDWKTASRSTTLPLDPYYLPSGQHEYIFNPSDPATLFIGSNGGVYMGTSISEEYISFQSMNRDYIASQCYAIGTTAEKNINAGGIQNLGTMLIDGNLNPGDAKRGIDIWTTASGLPVRDNGGYVAYSVIYPAATMYSTYPQPATVSGVEQFVRRNEYGGGTDWSDNMFDDQFSSDGFLTPFLLWEEFDFQLSKDSVDFYIARDYPAGTELWIPSNNAGRPFKYTTTTNLQRGDTLTVMDPIAARFFIGGTDQVVMTKDIVQFGVIPEWFVISDEDHNGISGVPQSMNLSADGNHLFVGTIEGQLFRISNIAYAYNFETADVNSPFSVISTQRIPILIPGTSDEIEQVITSVAVNPNDPNNVIVTLGNYGNGHYVFMTNNALDGNPQFRSIQGDPNNGGLPEMPVYSSLIEMDPVNNLVIVGTDYGIYITENVNAQNPTWTPQNKTIGKVPVFMLKQQLINKPMDVIPLVDPNNDTTYLEVAGNNNYGVIYAATYGRGLIYVDEFQKPVGIADHPYQDGKAEMLTVYPNPASGYVNFDLELSSASRVVVNIFDLQGQMVSTREMGQRSPGLQKIRIDTENLPGGTYILQVLAGQKSRTAKFVVF